MRPLAAALERSSERSRPRLEALFGMSDDAFLNGDRMLHYAMARALCGWWSRSPGWWSRSSDWWSRSSGV